MIGKASQNISVLSNRIQKIFHEVLSELFLDKWLCEDAKLQLFLIKTSNNSKTVYFVNQSGKQEQIDCNGANDYREVIRNYIECESIKNKEFFAMQELDSFEEDQSFQYVFVLLSECLRSNKGRLLLMYIFENFIKQIKNLPEKNQKAKSTTVTDSGFVQLILENAERNMIVCLERLYAPFNFQSVIGLSGEYYERSECRANLVFLPRTLLSNIKRTDWVFRFSQKKQDQMDLISSKTRLFRKLMQMTQDDLCLVLQEKDEKKTFQAVGICSGKALDQIFPALPYMKVKIRKHMQWDLFLGNTYIVTYQNGHYRINYPMQESYLRKKLSSCFGESEYQKLIDQILESVNQKHGTMLVVMQSNDAKEEVKRLSSLNYGIESRYLKSHKEDINYLNSIDGSVILDLKGNIYGIGVILDGDPSTKGNLAKGSRHNSALKYRAYLQKKQVQGMIVVISEDGSMELHTSEGGQ